MTDTNITINPSTPLNQVAPGRPQIMVLRERFETRREELKNSLPSDISVDRFIRAVITAAQINPDIQACAWQSIWLACLQACRDGLMPDGVEGAIVPYKSRATWIPMYQGLLRRFRRSGQFKWVTANVVRQGEQFEHWIDETGEHLRHVPGDSITNPIVKVYAMATTKDGALFVSVMSIAEANKVRGMSRATRDDAPWKQWPEEMYKKTVLRRLSKYLPSARDYIGEDEAPEQVEEEPAPRRTGAAAALEQFAPPQMYVEATPQDVEAAPSADLEGGGEQDTPASENAPHAPHGEGVPAATDPLTIARERGRDAKAKGHLRKAVPAEYREAARSQECQAWLDGWDGK